MKMVVVGLSSNCPTAVHKYFFKSPAVTNNGRESEQVMYLKDACRWRILKLSADLTEILILYEVSFFLISDLVEKTR